jgi:hypothetical protein
MPSNPVPTPHTPIGPSTMSCGAVGARYWSAKGPCCYLLKWTLWTHIVPNKANGDEFRVNRRHVAADLVYFVGDLAWIHSRFMGMLVAFVRRAPKANWP